MDSTGIPEITVSWPVPVVTVTTPADGATYKLGQTVDSSFSCTDIPGGIAIADCYASSGDLTFWSPGPPIDTSTLGSHEFDAFVIDANELVGETIVTYTVVGS